MLKYSYIKNTLGWYKSGKITNVALVPSKMTSTTPPSSPPSSPPSTPPLMKSTSPLTTSTTKGLGLNKNVKVSKILKSLGYEII